MDTKETQTPVTEAIDECYQFINSKYDIKTGDIAEIWNQLTKIAEVQRQKDFKYFASFKK